MESLNRILCGIAVPFFLLLSGLFFLFRIGRFFLKHPVRAFGGLFCKGAPRGEGTPPLRALAVALAGTLGVGNIAGVASAIYMGGAGAVFWMWVAGGNGTF